MKKNIILALLLLAQVSCKKDKAPVKKEEYASADSITNKFADTLKNNLLQEQQKEKTKDIETESEYGNGEKWIKNSVENYFKDFPTRAEKIATKKYIEFKSDAINVDLDTDGALTPEQFKNKWSKIYDINLVNHESFLIGLQDFENVKVTSVKMTKITKTGAWYHIVIKDSGSGVSVNRDIRIIKNGDSFLIDEVLEN